MPVLVFHGRWSMGAIAAHAPSPPLLLGQSSPAATMEWLNQGIEQINRQEFAAAAITFQKALEMARQARDIQSEWFALYGLITVFYGQRNFTQAAGLAEQALPIATKLGPSQQVATLMQWGDVLAGAADWPKAAQIYQQALTLAQHRKMSDLEPQIRSKLAQVYRQMGDGQRAVAPNQPESAAPRGPNGQSPAEGDPLWRLLQEANALFNQGKETSVRQAIDQYETALQIARQRQDALVEGTILMALSASYSRLGQRQRSLEVNQQAVEVSRASGNPALEATTLLGLGRAWSLLGEPQKALVILQQTVEIFQKLGDRGGEATSWNNIGNTYLRMGNPQQAEQAFQNALAISQQIGDSTRQARERSNLGQVYADVGLYQYALDLYEQALKEFRRLGEPAEESTALNNIATVYHALGQPQRALDLLQESRQRLQGYADPSREAIVLSNMGVIYSNRREFTRATEQFQRALTLFQQAEDREGEAAVLGNLGVTHQDQRQFQLAIDLFNQALAINRRIESRGGIVFNLVSLGNVYAALNQHDRALESIQQGLALARQMGDRDKIARSLTALGRVYLATQRPVQAIGVFQEAINLFEQLRAGLGGNDLNRISLLDEQARVYRLLQRALLVQNQPEAALVVAERGRGRALVELLSQRLAPQVSRVESLNLQQIRDVARTQNATIVQYSILRDDLDITQIQPIEQELLIWVISPNGQITLHRSDLRGVLQGGISLSELVRISREVMGAGSRGFSFNENPELRSALPLPVTPTDGIPHLKQLYNLLIQPIADRLPADPNQPVILVPQGALFMVPFAALQDGQGRSLIERHTLLATPSIQTLDLMYQQRMRRGIDTRMVVGSAEALIVGNPTMPSLSPRMGEPPVPLSSLPGAETEARTIARLLNTDPLIGSQAKESVVAQKMQRANVIHLATHGLLDDFSGFGVPGAIALAPDTNAQQLPAGLLTASEILDLRLKANLVVLSACDTGRGRITGDGVVGLSRALISAGADNVLVSLWKVPDEPTAALMVEFYRQLQQDGLLANKARALRQAMLATRQKYPDPLDWAGFVLIGEAN